MTPAAIQAPSLHSIRVERLTHRFRTRTGQATLALDDVSFEFPAGQLTAIVGPSGCGKSTLLLLLRGLLEPSRGRIAFDYAEGDAGRRAGPAPGMATVWQAFNLLPWRTVVDNVAFGLELGGMARAEREARALKAIKAVDLAGFENHYPGQLSGGMRQRVGLARGLVMEPEILFLDEPFGALDAQTRLYLQEQLATLIERSGKTAILVTHSIEEAIFLADRVLVMTARPGRVAAEIDIDLPHPRGIEVQNTPRFGELFTQIYGLLRDEVRKSMMS